MSDAVDTLARQIEEWELRVREARETLQVGDSILPHLRGALSLAKGELPQRSARSVESVQGQAQAQGQDAEAPRLPAPVVEPVEELEVLKKGDEVQAGILAVLGQLDDRFEQGDVDSALREIGFEVNRSTLRQNLLMMAKAEEGLAVAVPGKGRKATIFRKKDS